MSGRTWTSRDGVSITDLVAGPLRRAWVQRGDCPDLDVHAAFRERVRAHSSREAVCDAERVLDYAELDREVRRVAGVLAENDIGAHDIVGIRMPNGWRHVVAELAVAALGAVALVYPPGSGRRDTVALLGRSRARAAVFGSAADADDIADLPHLRAVFTFGCGETGSRSLDVADQLVDIPVPEVDPEAPARILVTSGSQAEPKMVAYSHNAMLGGRANYVRALQRGRSPMRAAMLMPLGSSYGSCATFVALAALGSTVLLQPRFDPAAALRLVTRGRASHLFAVPTMLRRLAELAPTDDEDLSELRTVVSSSAPLSAVTARAGSDRLGAEVLSVYGSTDGMNCHTAATGIDAAAGTGEPDPSVARIGVADEHGRWLPDGEPGEILARGPMTPLSYVAAPELDERYRTAEGWVRSGDRGVLDERGQLHVLGRLQQVVVRGGHNISPAEVEREIAAHPEVVDVVCVGVPDDDLGERMCACLSLATGSSGLELAALTGFLADERGLETRKLPEFLLVLPELPLAPTGKVCRRTTQALATEHTQGSVRARATGNSPTTEQCRPPLAEEIR